MSAVKSQNTKPELITRHKLFERGLRYRLHVKKLPGNPDLVFPRYKTIIFVNGCFWHKHKNCRRANLPESNREFWRKKQEKNNRRDNNNYRQLKKIGWRCIVLWECKILKKSMNWDLLAMKIKCGPNLP